MGSPENGIAHFQKKESTVRVVGKRDGTLNLKRQEKHCVPYIRKEDWQYQKEIVRLQCKMGFPFALQHVLAAVGGMILQLAINRQGVAFVAGFTAANKVFGLLENSAISIGHAVTAYMAQNYENTMN